MKAVKSWQIVTVSKCVLRTKKCVLPTVLIPKAYCVLCSPFLHPKRSRLRCLVGFFGGRAHIFSRFFGGFTHIFSALTTYDCPPLRANGATAKEWFGYRLTIFLLTKNKKIFCDIYKRFGIIFCDVIFLSFKMRGFLSRWSKLRTPVY